MDGILGTYIGMGYLLHDFNVSGQEHQIVFIYKLLVDEFESVFLALSLVGSLFHCGEGSPRGERLSEERG